MHLKFDYFKNRSENILFILPPTTKLSCILIQSGCLFWGCYLKLPKMCYENKIPYEKLLLHLHLSACTDAKNVSRF